MNISLATLFRIVCIHMFCDKLCITYYVRRCSCSQNIICYMLYVICYMFHVIYIYIYIYIHIHICATPPKIYRSLLGVEQGGCSFGLGVRAWGGSSGWVALHV